MNAVRWVEVLFCGFEGSMSSAAPVWSTLSFPAPGWRGSGCAKNDPEPSGAPGQRWGCCAVGWRMGDVRRARRAGHQQVRGDWTQVRSPMIFWEFSKQLPRHGTNTHRAISKEAQPLPESNMSLFERYTQTDLQLGIRHKYSAHTGNQQRDSQGQVR